MRRCSDLKKKSVGLRVPDACRLRHGANTACGNRQTHCGGCNYTTLEVVGNGGEKMLCEFSDNLWKTLPG